MFPEMKLKPSPVVTHRRKQAKKGLVRVEVQASNADALLLRDTALALRSGSRRAAQVRSTLRRALRPHDSLFDLLALDIADDVMAEVLERPREFGRQVKL